MDRRPGQYLSCGKAVEVGGVIQPYYIVDEGRKSVKKELRAISRISVELRKWPMVRGVLLDTIVVEKKDIRQYPDITEAWKHLHQKYNLGSQYDWLARFARQERLKLMVGVQMDPRGRVVHTLGGKQLPLEEVKEGIEAFTIAGIEDIDADAKLLYSDLLFPRLVVGVAKVQEWQELSDMGLEKVAKMTWFCHRPVFGLPCGHCNPCKDVLHEGLAFRVPLLGHIMGWGRSWIGRIIHRES